MTQITIIDNTIIMQNKIQGGQELELKFVDETRT